MAGGPVGFDFDNQLIARAAMTEFDPSIDLKVVCNLMLIFHRPDLNAGHSTKQILGSVHGSKFRSLQSFYAFHQVLKIAFTVKKSSDFINKRCFKMWRKHRNRSNLLNPSW